MKDDTDEDEDYDHVSSECSESTQESRKTRKRNSTSPSKKASKRMKSVETSKSTPASSPRSAKSGISEAEEDNDKSSRKRVSHYYETHHVPIKERLNEEVLLDFCGVTKFKGYAYPDIPPLHRFKGLEEWFRMRFLVDVHAMFCHREKKPTKASNGTKRYHVKCSNDSSDCDYELVIISETHTRNLGDEEKVFVINKRGRHTCKENLGSEDSISPRLLNSMLVKLYFYDFKDQIILAPDPLSFFLKCHFGLYITNHKYRLSYAIKKVKSFSTESLSKDNPTLFDIWCYFTNKVYQTLCTNRFKPVRYLL